MSSITLAEPPVCLPLYTAAQSRRIDAAALREMRDSGYALMERAGRAAYERLRQFWPLAESICVVCGPGNNGGDGWIVARLAKKTGLKVHVRLVGSIPVKGREAAEAHGAFVSAGGQWSAFDGCLPEADLYVDALFGTGLHRPPEGLYLQAIEALAGKPVLAIDVPSGIDSDTGLALGSAVKAQRTISFITRKRGLLTGMAVDYTGILDFDDLNVPEMAYNEEKPAAWVTMSSPCWLPRLKNSNKGDYGRVLVIGSGPGYPGAARLTAEAALRAGAGLVMVATHPDHVPFLNIGRYELIVRGVADGRALTTLFEGVDVIAVGPGLGQDEWGRSVWQAVQSIDKPLVVDADALNLLAQAPMRRDRWILTPHPGEASRLLGWPIATVQADRFNAAETLAARTQAAIVLKGAGSIVRAGEVTRVCSAGNPGMAVAGMGDVLTGIIAGLIGQGLSIEKAAWLGVEIHARAGDQVAMDGERGFTAKDVIEAIRPMMNRGMGS